MRRGTGGMIVGPVAADRGGGGAIDRRVVNIGDGEFLGIEFDEGAFNGRLSKAAGRCEGDGRRHGGGGLPERLEQAH